jgi:16S rRNA (cytidine1402-2'-O)-methyltransferase
MTFRAIDILKSVDTILAEDTRKSRILLNHFSIESRLESFHKFNEHGKLSSTINRIKSGEKIALISDAGTPGISDPGFLIIREAVKNGVEIETLPGATAFVPALVNSGLPCEKFVFEGFLPAKKGRQKRLKELLDEKRTMVFYESPYRIAKAVDEFITYFGEERQISITREISKIYEENIRGTLEDVKKILENRKLKGEFVIVLQGKTE